MNNKNVIRDGSCLLFRFIIVSICPVVEFYHKNKVIRKRKTLYMSSAQQDGISNKNYGHNEVVKKVTIIYVQNKITRLLGFVRALHSRTDFCLWECTKVIVHFFLQ